MEQQTLIDEALFEARMLISENRDLLDCIAEALLAKESIERNEIRRSCAVNVRRGEAAASVPSSACRRSQGFTDPEPDATGASQGEHPAAEPRKSGPPQ